MKELDESIFTAISSYIPHPGINPIENFLTELLAWMINNVDDFGCDYVKYLVEKGNLSINNLNNLSDVEAKTQVHISSGFIDMLINTNIGISFICEHKVDSELSENQIKKYMDNSNELGSDRFFSVLLTKSTSQQKQEADVILIWSNIDELIGKLTEKQHYQEIDLFIAKQFSIFLQEEGLGMGNVITEEELKYYLSAKRIENTLYNIFNELAREKWDEIPALKSFPRTRDDFKPTFNRLKWGRIGISFFEKWEPGLFAGVILDGTDHCLPPKDESKGPDFVVLLDIQKNNNEIYNNALQSDWLKRIKSNLKKSCDPFSEYIEKPKNSWRLIILRKSLSDIIDRCNTVEEQTRKIKEIIIDGLKLIVGDR